MAIHTLVVEFDGPTPTYAAGDRVLGGRLVAVDFDGDRLAVAEELLEALQAVVRVADRATVEFDMARTAIAKATQ